jgi:arylsulfatase A-like enzyme
MSISQVFPFRGYVAAFIFLLPLLACNASAEKKPEKPNIIYILADDLGIGDLRSFNLEGKIPTPHLDKLASEGMKLTDAHTSSSVCTPTRYGILTGRYSWRSPLKQGVLYGYDPALIDQERPTVATLLKGAGYHTAFIGKWHLGWNWEQNADSTYNYEVPITHGPNTLGFDYAYGHVASLDMPPYVYVENGHVTEQPNRLTENTDEQGFWREGPTGADFVHEQVTPHFFDKAIAYVQERAETAQPFFLYLPLPSPHTPILPTEPWRGQSGLNVYGDFVMEVDHYVGDLMEALEKAGVASNTIVIFTSDNGCSPRADYPALLAQGHNPSGIYRGHKADLFEGGNRVPMIIRWPGHIPAGAERDALVCTTDLMATCADILGIDLPRHAGEDSQSMLPLFAAQQEKAPVRTTVIHHSINGSFAIRQGKWKLLACPGSGGWSDPKPQSEEAERLPPVQLYDLSDDPGEQNNVYSQHPEKVQQLGKLLLEQIEQGRSTEGAAAHNDASESWHQLEALYDLFGDM